MLWKTPASALALVLVLAGSALAACAPPTARSPEQPEATEAEPGAAAEGEAEAEEASGAESSLAQTLSHCHESGGLCLPSPKFVTRLCDDVYPSLALHLFAKDSPFARGYLRGKVKAWNASGGVSDNEAWLAFDEEVVLLRKRGGPSGGMQVSGADGGYDALRWDGSCVTLSTSEVSLDPPPQPKAAKVEWRFLDGSTQEALRENAEVTEAYRTRRKECKGAVSGTVSLKCVKADEKLSQLIVDHVRGGGGLATPEKVP